MDVLTTLRIIFMLLDVTGTPIYDPGATATPTPVVSETMRCPDETLGAVSTYDPGWVDRCEGCFPQVTETRYAYPTVTPNRLTQTSWATSGTPTPQVTGTPTPTPTPVPAGTNTPVPGHSGWGHRCNAYEHGGSCSNEGKEIQTGQSWHNGNVGYNSRWKCIFGNCAFEGYVDVPWELTCSVSWSNNPNGWNTYIQRAFWIMGQNQIPGAIPCGSSPSGYCEFTATGTYLNAWYKENEYSTSSSVGFDCGSCQYDVTCDWKVGIDAFDPGVNPTPTPTVTPTLSPEDYCTVPIYNQYYGGGDDDIITVPGIGWTGGSCFTILPGWSFDITAIKQLLSGLDLSFLPDIIGWDGFEICTSYIWISDLIILEVPIPVDIIIALMGLGIIVGLVKSL